MHKVQTQSIIRRANKKVFLLSCTKKLVTAVSSPLGCQNTICQLSYCLLAASRKKYENFFYFTIPFPSGSQAQKVKLAEYFCVWLLTLCSSSSCCGNIWKIY